MTSRGRNGVLSRAAFVEEEQATIRRNGEDNLTVRLPSGDVIIEMVGLDFRTCREELDRHFGIQTYFAREEDARKLIAATGFFPLNHDLFSYISSRTGGKIQTDVFTLQKSPPTR